MSEGEIVSLYDLISSELKKPQKVFVDSACISIRVDSGSLYEITLNSIDTHKKLVEWIHHLTEKTWVTGEIIHDVINAAIHANKLAFYGENQ